MKSYHILITGRDLTGKTELLSRLEEMFTDKGYNVKINKGNLKKTPLSALTDILMSKNPQPERTDKILGVQYDFFVNSLLLVSYLIDAAWYEGSGEETVVLQDTYSERTGAIIAGREVPLLSEIIEATSEHLFQFDACIMLTATPETRIERLQKRGGDAMDYTILTHSDESERTDEYLLQEMKKRGNCLIIDTSCLNLEEVATIASDYLYKILEGE